MRILIATDHFPPFIGGAHRQARLIALAMAEQGHEVAVATPWHSGLPAVEDDNGVSIHRIRQLRTAIRFLARDPGQRHQPPFPDPVTVIGLKRLIRRFEPDLIHAYGWFAFSVAAALGRRRIPLLVSARDYGYFCATRTLYHDGGPCSGPAPVKCLTCAANYYGPARGTVAALGVAVSKPLLARRMSGLHSVSSFVEEVTLRHMDTPEGMPAVTIPSFQQKTEDEGAADIEQWLAQLPLEPFILYVGAFRKVKGLETLFDAYRRLQDPPPLVLMGTFERDSPSDFPPEATVLTDVPNAAVMAAWDRAMFGVLPSIWPEPFGATVAEGMSRGKPVIGSLIGGHTDMIDGSNGILIRQGDAGALASAMERLIADPLERERLGAAAAARARDFAAPVVLPRFAEVYRRVADLDQRP
jgi:glycosyltransferase involved in cell wall biosynthesis